jgi:hypothetical protein
MQRDRRDYLSIRKTVGAEGWRLRRAHMARGMIGLAVVVLLTAMLPSPAGAQQIVGEHCWTLDPFVDTLRLAITQPTITQPNDPNDPKDTQPNDTGAIFEVHGRWLATAAEGQQAAGGAGPASYQLLAAGAMTESVTLPNDIELGFAAVHNTTFFGGNSGCNLYAVINQLTLSGPFSFQCPGPTPFTAQGTMNLVFPCPDQF